MVYKGYILPIGGLYATYHLLGEPETAIEPRFAKAPVLEVCYVWLWRHACAPDFRQWLVLLEHSCWKRGKTRTPKTTLL